MSFALGVAKDITDQLDAAIAKIAPDAGRRSMYGGYVFEKQAGVASTMVCGHFIYQLPVNDDASDGRELFTSRR